MKPLRVAILGGDDYDAPALEDFLYKIHDKYPDSVIVTGGERGAEKAARVLLEAIGHAVEVPPKPADWGNPSDWQAYSCMSGELGKPEDRADIIVAVGNPDSHRAALAIKHWKRMDSWRLPENQRQLVQVAVTKSKPKRKARPKKNAERLAA